MKLSDLMELRSVCKAFLESTMDETHGGEIADSVISGQLEALVQQAIGAYTTYLRSQFLDEPTIAAILVRLSGLEIRRKKKS